MELIDEAGLGRVVESISADHVSRSRRLPHGQARLLAVAESLRHHLECEFRVARLIPGEMDTGMKIHLCESDPTEFPLASDVRGKRANLIPAEMTAPSCRWELIPATTETFNRYELWFVDDRPDHPFCVGEGTDLPCTAP